MAQGLQQEREKDEPRNAPEGDDRRQGLDSQIRSSGRRDCCEVPEGVLPGEKLPGAPEGDEMIFELK